MSKNKGMSAGWFLLFTISALIGVLIALYIFFPRDDDQPPPTWPPTWTPTSTHTPTSTPTNTLTSTPAPTFTSTPTYTPLPTDTPVPTYTSTPTPTRTQTPTPVPPDTLPTTGGPGGTGCLLILIGAGIALFIYCMVSAKDEYRE